MNACYGPGWARRQRTQMTRTILETQCGYGGYRIGWTRWFLAGYDADDGWDLEITWAEDATVYPTQEACQAAIKEMRNGSSTRHQID